MAFRLADSVSPSMTAETLRPFQSVVTFRYEKRYLSMPVYGPPGVWLSCNDRTALLFWSIRPSQLMALTKPLVASVGSTKVGVSLSMGSSLPRVPMSVNRPVLMPYCSGRKVGTVSSAEPIA